MLTSNALVRAAHRPTCSTVHAPPQLILLGPPGAGKGTQAVRLAKRLGIVHISPGQILRERTGCDSAEGRRIRELIAAGDLAPEELINRLVRERLESLSPEQGFVLDGYPRTSAEARFLRRTLVRMNRAHPQPIAIWLKAPRAVLIARLRQRAREQHRSDDTEQAIAHRLDLYGAQAWPLWETLEGWTKRLRVSADGAPDAVTAEILNHLARESVATRA